MKTQEIRRKFTEYFAQNGHEKIPSSSLIPENDPTLLFANAGMNQFKDFFTGKATPKNPRATTIQKCVRAGGKHNDLDNVGMTARHHTFFEMLGNFSFGNYFKKDAIHFAWEFLTKTLGMDKNKLYVTVHYTDDEAIRIWNEQEGVPLERIFKKGDKDNFWEMGEFGPCGPCSEIFFDHGEKYTDPDVNPNRPQEQLLDDEKRYVEIWNLVFMQFEKSSEGTKPLPKPSIDTGAGLERLAAALQGKYWNYDIDAFAEIIGAMERITGRKYSDPQNQTPMRVVADHIRSATMLITDGVIPSQDGRGYVLRKIIRRAIIYMRKLNMQNLSQLAPLVLQSLGEEYPQNKAKEAVAVTYLALEEKRFLETLDQGLKYLGEAIEKNPGKKTLSGETVFKLYDTYGLPIDVTNIILKEKGMEADAEGFEEQMKKQKELSRKSWKGNLPTEDNPEFRALLEKSPETLKRCYDALELEATLKKVAQVGDTAILTFDQTPFYGESGGQSGDTGEIWETVKGTTVKIASINNTQVKDGKILHYSDAEASQFHEGQKYFLKVDTDKRELIKRNHSATHLLQAALMKTLGPHVQQAGSLVTAEKLRFDFTHTQGLTPDEIRKVEFLVNEQIQKNVDVHKKETSKEDALKMGALAFFGEKYGEKVRVLKMGDFSVELCGGTHVDRTSEIGLFSILSEGSLSSGVRRIEALTSAGALKLFQERSQALKKVENLFQTAAENIPSRVETVLSDYKALQKAMDQLKQKAQGEELKELFENPEKISNHLLKIVQAPPNADLKLMSDQFVELYPQGVLVLYRFEGDKTMILVKAHKQNTAINCSDILKQCLALIEGRGGGKPDLAQGSGKTPENPKEFLEKLHNTLRAKLQ